MFSKIADFLTFILVLIVSLLELASSDADRHVYTTEERISAIEENMSEYNALANYAFQYTNDASPLDSVFEYEVERKSGESFPGIKNQIQDKILVHHTADNDYVVFEYHAGTPGYSSSGVYYSVEDVYIVPQSNTPAEYEEETDRYMAYFNANCVQVIKVTDHWYFYQKAFYNDAGFEHN